jgi:alpha-tubulin suppressor-like RCC1 family protein
MCIYYDTHLATGTNQYYAPSGGWTELGPLVSLASGDVLDLSGLSGPQTPNATVRISGNATIIGGGAGTTAISGLTIETYGGNLTLSNLCVTANNGPLINNVSGPLTVVVLGSNSLATTVGPAVVSTSGANITFTCPGSLAVTTTDNQAPAVQATGDIIVTGATNLTFISSGSTSLAATRIFIYNSTVTSKVVWETDNEFAAGTIALGNSVLDMSYGIINPYIISPCTWLGHIRNTSHFTVQQTHSLDFGQGMFEDGVYVQLAGTTGTSKFNNINLISQDAYYDDVSVLQHNGTVNFTMSYSITNNGTNYFQGLGKLQSIQIYKEDDVLYTWEFESADITSNVMGDVASTYHVAGNDTWINTTNIYPFPSVTENTNPFGYTINPDNKTVTITGFTGAGALIIPSSMHGYPVTGIAANAFWANTTLTSVTIPGSVTSIYDQAFLDCCGLTAVYFQGNAPSLGANVFAYVNATAHSLPGTTGWGATYGCLTTALWVPFTCTTNSDNATVTLTGYTGLGGAVIIPNLINGLPVTGIAANAFQTNTALTSITIPASVTSIPDQAFENCYCLTAVYFQGSAPSLGANVFTGADLATVYYLPVPGTTGWDATFGGLPTALWEPFASTTNSDNATVTLTGYTGPGGTVTIPGTLNGLSVTSIGANAFTTNLLVSALQITNVLIPNTVTNLGDGAFQRCSNLVGVYFQGNAPSLGANVFAGDALATAYSLPATTGWGAMFGVLRTAPWLTVNGGTNGGDYSNLQQVTITANNPTPTNGLMAPLVQWTGTTQYVANVNSANTTVAMPAQPVTLTAMFEVAPVITAQPASLAAISGGNATFNVTAWGPAPLAYQWYFNNSSISGATAASQTLTGVTTNDVGSYSVVVTNLYGSVTSSVASLTVDVPPSITTQPASQVAAVGGAVNLSASTAGTAPFAYQWFKNGGMVLGATNSALTLASAGVTNSGVYYVVVTNAYGLSISLPASVAVGTPQLLAWGYNNNGELGDGSTADNQLPESVASDVVSAAAGGAHSLLVKADGTLWAMGYNGDGELGDGTQTQRTSPISVASNVVAAAAGQAHSLYLRSDGTLWAMGGNGNGQLGDGTTTSRGNAVSVASNVVAVAAGSGHSLYLKSDGTLWAMGGNGNGQLGDGTTTSRSLAESVASNVAAVAAGADHSLYLKSDGTLWAMGINQYGQLGDGSTTSHSLPESVAGNVVAVAAGAEHSLYLKRDGTLWAMGGNGNGQLGDGTTTNSLLPETVASNVVAMTAGAEHSLYLKRDGTLWAMGGNGNGQLGDGTTTQRNRPVSVTGMSLANIISGSLANHTLAVGVPLPPVITSQPASQTVLAGSDVTFTIAANGFAPLDYQWYANGYAIGGETATNFSLSDVTPGNAANFTVVVRNAGGRVTSTVAALMVGRSPSITAQPANQVVAVGGTVNLSAAMAGTAPFAYQWFKNGGMVLGATNSALTLANAGVTNSGVYYVVVTNAYGLSISLPASVVVGAPQLLAWGNNGYGQLGDGTTTGRNLPEPVASNVVAAVAGGDQSLYLKSDGTLWAVGFNGDGELGDGTGVNRDNPESVASNVVSVAAGAWHSLYLKSDGTLWVVGQNNYGQLGDGTTTSRSNAVSVASNVVAAAAGGGHTLYLKCDGTLWAMGENNYGQLGNGTMTNRSLAESVASNVVAVAAGASHSLYLKSDGTLWAMGYNGDGELGDGTTFNRSNAIPVAGGSNVVALAAGDNHSLFSKADGTLWAMGQNDSGQLGDGTTTSRSNAVSVASDVVAVAAGGLHSLYLKSDGALWAMGRNNSGQLGDGTTTPWNGQVQVSGMALASVVSGRSANHTLAVGVPLPPVITSQPASQKVLAGSNVTFTVAAGGFAPLAFQWYANGYAMGGETATNFSLSDVVPANSANFTVVVSNAGGSVTSTVAVLTVLKANASVTLGDLSQTYDGTAKHASAVTSPANLTVNTTYNGGAAPTDAGSYTVIGTVSDANYDGSATNTLVIATASASVTLGNLSQTCDGTAKNVSVVTLPANLTVNVTYNGSTFAPVNAGTYTVVATVTDANYWGSATNTLVISPPPILDPIPDQIAQVLMPLLVTNCAANSSLVSRPLTFGLCIGTPGGVRMKEVCIDGSTNKVCTNGVLGWIPTREQARSTNTIMVWMRDSGSPPVLATNTFTVVVDDYAELSVGGTILFTGLTSSVPVTLMSSLPATVIAAVGLTNVEAVLHVSEAQLTELALTDWAPELGNAVVQKQAADTWQIQFTAAPGQVLQTTQQLAQLQFLAVSTNSAFVPLQVSDVTAFQMNGQSVWRTLAGDGRAVVLGNEPLVEALPKTNGYPDIVVYGAPGTGYDVLFSPVAATGALWQPVWLGTMPSNMQMPVSGLTNTESTMFFRARTHAN